MTEKSDLIIDEFNWSKKETMLRYVDNVLTPISLALELNWDFHQPRLHLLFVMCLLPIVVTVCSRNLQQPC